MATRPTPTALKRLGDRVTARRAQLNLPKAAVAEQAGLTAKTYYKIENGEWVRETTYAKVEPVLQWAHGSCLAILGGAEPVIAEPTGAPGVYLSPILPGDLERLVEQAVQNAAIAVTNLPASEIRALKQRVVDELRSEGGRDSDVNR
ncbi:helix-turn-helix domain-containing protein [Streptomyces sp. URMC 124]|uniref:helix-turn-helix domain-containing protein n=1 Tax=Streptomyces sp. URMC 124 TaxID=3423405 RepID=UPI003F1D26C3